ncbi:MAG TPA: hypothetical protein VGR25_08860 [bacterium]|nr:hypothetical protein [bacterium]
MRRIVPAQRQAVGRTPVRVVIAALLTVVAAGSWDVWWHVAVGRDTFWEPPHVLLQAGVAATVVAAVVGWWGPATADGDGWWRPRCWSRCPRPSTRCGTGRSASRT